MASLSFQWWDDTSVLYPPQQNGYQIDQTTIVDSKSDWLVTILQKDGGSKVIDGVTYPSGQLWVLGRKAAIDPPTPVFTENTVRVSGDNFDLSIPAFGPYPPGPPAEGYFYNGFYFYSKGYGGESKGYISPDYEYDTLPDIFNAIDNGEIVEVKPTVYFDVYINGTDQPNIFVNWTANEELSPVTLSPRVCIGVQEAQIEIVPHDIREYEGLNDPDITQWFVEVAGDFSYDSSYSTSYISIMDNFAKYLNPVSRVQRWGIDGIPDFVRLYLRIVYGEEIGDLYRVVIQKDGTPIAQLIDNSSRNASFYTVVRFHTGEPDYVIPDDPDTYPHGSNDDGTEDGRYNPDQTPADRDFSDGDGIGFDGNAVLTTTYAVSAATLKNIGQKLWTQSYFDVLKIQSNPIENIVSVKCFPFEFTGGTSKEVVVGDVAFGINGDEIPRMKVIDVGSYKYPTDANPFGNYLDLSPFTVCKLNLPYIGLIQLDPAELFHCTLSVKYVIDTLTGQCLAILELDGIPYMNCYGNMGVDIPLTSTDRVQTELRAASTAFNVGASAAGQLMGGELVGGGTTLATGALNIAGADYSSQRTTSQSPACATYENHYVFLLIERPLTDLAQVESEGFSHLRGLPCHKYMKLSSFAMDTKAGGGFVQIEARTDINIGMTSEENALLEQLLTTGVYV